MNRPGDERGAARSADAHDPGDIVVRTYASSATDIAPTAAPVVVGVHLAVLSGWKAATVSGPMSPGCHVAGSSCGVVPTSTITAAHAAGVYDLGDVRQLVALGVGRANHQHWSAPPAVNEPAHASERQRASRRSSG